MGTVHRMVEVLKHNLGTPYIHHAYLNCDKVEVFISVELSEPREVNLKFIIYLRFKSSTE